MTALRGLDNLRNSVFAADVARINAERVNAALDRYQCKFLMKVNIRNKRNMDSFFDLGQRMRCLFIRHGAANDLATDIFKTAVSVQRSLKHPRSLSNTSIEPQSAHHRPRERCRPSPAESFFA
jgi:hypothetical protein